MRGHPSNIANLDIDVPDEVIPEVIAHVHLGNFSELAELLVDLLEEVFELREKRSEAIRKRSIHMNNIYFVRYDCLPKKQPFK